MLASIFLEELNIAFRNAFYNFICHFRNSLSILSLKTVGDEAIVLTNFFGKLF